MQLFPEHREAAIFAAPDEFETLIRDHVDTAVYKHEAPEIKRLAQTVIDLRSKVQRQGRLQYIQDNHPILFDRVSDLAYQLWKQKKECRRG